MFRLLFVLAVVQAKTVRYSNVPPRAAIAKKTYDLAVPGSAPIRIIEAEPIWSPEVVTSQQFDDENRRNKHKTGKEYTTQATKTNITETVTNSYSSEALNNFLKEYTQKIKDGRKKFDVNYLENVTEEPTNKLASIYLENDRMDDDKSKAWGLVDVKRHKHPYDDKKGWVTLEAVPWSTSKISKWKSNNKNEQKPWENNHNNHHINWNTKYSNNPFKNSYSDSNDNYNSHSNNNFNDNDYNNGYDEQLNNNDNIFLDKPVTSYDDVKPSADMPRPQIARPIYGLDVKPIKIKPDQLDWPQEVPSKPSWNSRPQNNPIPDPWSDRNTAPVFFYGTNSNKDDSRDIITDGKPNDFPNNPNSYPNYETIQERPSASNLHPVNHPSNGNGEWVLVSTTKGYQLPRNKRQRSIEVTPDSVGTRRGIRLTVLPPDNDKHVNMTTSHGGLLEVESSFETVEESHHKLTQEINNSTLLPHKIKKPQSQVFVSRPRPTFPKRPLTAVKRVPTGSPEAQDATAVLAAVGAGMVPATMAMLVPFVAGRKKRSIEDNLQLKIHQVPFKLYYTKK